MEPLKNISLGKDDIHIWTINTDQLTEHANHFFGLLSVDERKRAVRFRFTEDRERFVITRGVLRILIGSYLGIEAQQVRFCYGVLGKPAIEYRYHQIPLNFNLSHSGNISLIILARHRKVGIDVEYIRNIPEVNQLADLCFSNNEINILRKFHIDQQNRIFFLYWTRKEALIKAAGYGLYQSLRNVEVLSPFITLENGYTGAASGWYLQDLEPAPGYSAAYAMEGESSHSNICRQFHFSSEQGNMQNFFSRYP